MRELRLRFALKFRDDALRQYFAQLDAPLVKRIDVPDCTLGEHGMFVESHQFAEGFRSQSFRQNCV